MSTTDIGRGSASTLTFRALGKRVTVDCPDDLVMAIVAAGFGGMVPAAAEVDCSEPPSLYYTIERSATGFEITRGDGSVQFAGNAGAAAIALESDVLIELQRLCTDLLFLHAAGVEFDGNAYLLAAESGVGKTTTTWALLHHGFGFLSDELSPVDVSSLVVHPYPYALSFKSSPPAAYPLPPGGVDLGGIVHLPTNALPSPPLRTPLPVAGIFLLDARDDRRNPRLERLSPATASAHLYVTALNPLAHPEAGLAAVARLASGIPCFSLAAAGVADTCELLRRTVAELGLGAKSVRRV